MRTDLLWIMRQRVISLNMVMMMTVPMRSVYGFFVPSLRRSRSIIPIVVLSRLHLSLRSHRTWFMVRQPALCQTAEKQDSHFHREQTQATVQSRMVCWHPLTLLPRFLMSGLWTVFPIHRPSIRMHLVMRKRSARQIWYRLWTVTLIREHITLMSMYLARRSSSMQWSIRRKRSMLTLRSVYPVTPLSLLI